MHLQCADIITVDLFVLGLAHDILDCTGKRSLSHWLRLYRLISLIETALNSRVSQIIQFRVTMSLKHHRDSQYQANRRNTLAHID